MRAAVIHQLSYRKILSISASDFMQRYIIISQKTNKKMSGNTSKRGWTSDEDQIIISIMSRVPQDKVKWIQVSKTMEEKTGRLRTGKQCRERWQHQLNPAIVREEWSKEEQQILFSTQRDVGNKWAQISAFLPGRTDNAVKNFFYSSIRRVLTKLNLYLAKHKNRKQFKIIRQFEADYLSKLMAVVDGHFDKRVRLTSLEVISLAKCILKGISGFVSNEHLIDLEQPEEGLDSLILMMQDFRKNCKKRKQINLSEDMGRYPDSCSLDHESSPRESSESNFSEKKQKSVKSRRSSLQFCDKMGKMEIQNNESCEVILSAKNSTKQMEEEHFNYNCEPSCQQLQRFESYCEPILFKGISELKESTTEDDFMCLFRQEESVMKDRKLEEEWDWRGFQSNDIFLMSMGQREDMLGESQLFDSAGVVTKFKMLEASIALDQCLLKVRQFSHEADQLQS